MPSSPTPEEDQVVDAAARVIADAGSIVRDEMIRLALIDLAKVTGIALVSTVIIRRITRHRRSS